MIFTDECSIERGSGGHRKWVLGTPADKWKESHIDTYKKRHDISVMVWGAIWKSRRSDLVIMDRDDSARAQGYTSASYIDVLGEQIPRIWQPGLTFMQDNAPIHTSRRTMAFIEDMAIPLLEWPPYSPDISLAQAENGAVGDTSGAVEAKPD